MIMMYNLIFKDKLTKKLTNIKTYGSIILRIEFSIELQKEMLRSVQWLLRKLKFKSRCPQGRFLYRESEMLAPI